MFAKPTANKLSWSVLLSSVLFACGGGGSSGNTNGSGSSVPSGPPFSGSSSSGLSTSTQCTAIAAVPTAGGITVTQFAAGLVNPWGLVFLPDGRALVTERPGRMRIVATNGSLSASITGVPAVYASGQGGLLDVVLDPNYASNGLIYFSYAESGTGGAGTAVARAVLNPATLTLTSVTVIYRQTPKVSGDGHFGSRLVFGTDGKLYVSLGERQKFTPA